MQDPLSLYLIVTRNDKHLPFIPSDIVAEAESKSDDRIRHGINWVERRRNRIVAWMGRALQTAHKYYKKLEDKIDPVERVLKTLTFSRSFMVNYGPPSDDARAEEKLTSVLRGQRRKHVLWFAADLVISSVVIVLTPVLAPIPGPNVFFYYPVLRLISHYRAIRGCANALRNPQITFKCLPALGALEDNLRAPRVDWDIVRATAERLNMRGLEKFLKK